MGSEVVSRSPLPLVFHNRIVEHLIGEGGSGVISSSPLPLLYHDRRVELLIGGEWGD